jgi:hypothetical protein
VPSAGVRRHCARHRVFSRVLVRAAASLKVDVTKCVTTGDLGQIYHNYRF